MWDDPGDGFFLHHTPTSVAAITAAIHCHDLARGPLVTILDLSGQVSDEGATEIFLYARDRDGLFADSIAAIDAAKLRVAAARVATTASGVCFNSYIVLDDEGRRVVMEGAARARLAAKLTRTVAGGAAANPPRRVSRQLRQFVMPTEVALTTEPGAGTSVLRVVAADRPGVLATLGGLFAELGISVRGARITTLGERVEDVFEITNQAKYPITHAGQAQTIADTIRRRLDAEIAQMPQ